MATKFNKEIHQKPAPKGVQGDTRITLASIDAAMSKLEVEEEIFRIHGYLFDEARFMLMFNLNDGLFCRIRKRVSGQWSEISFKEKHEALAHWNSLVKDFKKRMDRSSF